jgi:hypothetical protein
MDAISSVIQSQQSALDTQIQFAIAAKALDMAKVQGDALNQMLEAAAQIGKAVGAGENFDAMG